MLGDENLEKFFSKIDAAEFGVSAGLKLASKNHKLAGSVRDGSDGELLKSKNGAEFCGKQAYSSGAQQAEILKFNAEPLFNAEQAYLKFNVRPSQAGLGAHPPQAQFDAERAQAKIENFMRDLLQNYVLCVSGAEFAFAEIEAYFTGADRNTYKRISRAGEIFFHNFGFDISFRSVPQSGGGILVRSLRVLSGAELLAGSLPGLTGYLPGLAGGLHGLADNGLLGSGDILFYSTLEFSNWSECKAKVLDYLKSCIFIISKIPHADIHLFFVLVNTLYYRR